MTCPQNVEDRLAGEVTRPGVERFVHAYESLLTEADVAGHITWALMIDGLGKAGVSGDEWVRSL